MIVVDSNVVSELMRSEPSPVVLTWLDRQAGNELVTTAVTAAEIGYGIARLPDGQRRDRLRWAAEEVFRAFADGVLPFDEAAARIYGDVVARRERIGRPIDGFDAQIASICRSRGAQLVTRNIRDFDGTDVVVTDPWRETDRG